MVKDHFKRANTFFFSRVVNRATKSMFLQVFQNVNSHPKYGCCEAESPFTDYSCLYAFVWEWQDTAAPRATCTDLRKDSSPPSVVGPFASFSEAALLEARHAFASVNSSACRMITSGALFTSRERDAQPCLPAWLRGNEKSFAMLVGLTPVRHTKPEKSQLRFGWEGVLGRSPIDTYFASLKTTKLTKLHATRAKNTPATSCWIPA